MSQRYRECLATDAFLSDQGGQTHHRPAEGAGDANAQQVWDPMSRFCGFAMGMLILAIARASGDGPSELSPGTVPVAPHVILCRKLRPPFGYRSAERTRSREILSLVHDVVQTWNAFNTYFCKGQLIGSQGGFISWFTVSRCPRTPELRTLTKAQAEQLLEDFRPFLRRRNRRVRCVSRVEDATDRSVSLKQALLTLLVFMSRSVLT